VRTFGNAHKGAPDKVLNAELFAHISHGGTLLNLERCVELFPIISHSEDGIGIFEGCSDGSLVVKIGLVLSALPL
jgi:hypothetical protein